MESHMRVQLTRFVRLSRILLVGARRAESEPKDREIADEGSKQTTPPVDFPKGDDDDDGISVIDGTGKRKRKHDDWIYPYNPPPYVPPTWWDYPHDFPRQWDGSPSVTC